MINYGIAFKRPVQNWGRFFLNGLVIMFFFILMLVIVLPLQFSGLFSSHFLLSNVPAIIAAFVFMTPFAYFVHCGMTAARNDFKMPGWKGINLVENGVMLGIVYIVYAIPLYLITFLVMYLSLGPAFMDDLTSISGASLAEQKTSEYMQKSQNVMKHMVPMMLIMMPVNLILGFIWYMLFSVAAFRFYEKQRLTEAFNLKEIINTAFNGTYFMALVFSGLIYLGLIAVFMLAIILLMITLIGIVLIPYALALFIYYIGVLLFTIIGQAYGEVTAAKPTRHAKPNPKKTAKRKKSIKK